MDFVNFLSNLIVKENRQVLLVKELKKESYAKLNLPSGHLEFGEKIFDGVIRETIEEVGIDIKPNGILGIYTGLTKDRTKHFTNFIFFSLINNVYPRLQDQVQISV